jgi:hypothetical protein
MAQDVISAVVGTSRKNSKELKATLQTRNNLQKISLQLPNVSFNQVHVNNSAHVGSTIRSEERIRTKIQERVQLLISERCN